MLNFDFEPFQVSSWAPAGQFIRQVNAVAGKKVKKTTVTALLGAVMAASSAFAFSAPMAAESHWPGHSGAIASSEAPHTDMPAASFQAFMERLRSAPALEDRSDFPDPDPFF